MFGGDRAQIQWDCKGSGNGDDLPCGREKLGKRKDTRTSVYDQGVRIACKCATKTEQFSF